MNELGSTEEEFGITDRDRKQIASFLSRPRRHRTPDSLIPGDD